MAKNLSKLPVDPAEWAASIAKLRKLGPKDRKLRIIASLLEIRRRIEADSQVREIFRSLVDEEVQAKALRSRNRSYRVVHIYAAANGAEKDRLAKIVGISHRRRMSTKKVIAYLQQYGVSAFITNKGKKPAAKSKMLTLRKATKRYRAAVARGGDAIVAELMRVEDGPALVLAHRKSGKIRIVDAISITVKEAGKIIQRHPGLLKKQPKAKLIPKKITPLIQRRPAH